MRNMLRALLVTVVVLLGALRSSGTTGGGDSGIWILPSCLPLGVTPDTINLPLVRASLSLPAVTGPVQMAMGNGMGAPISRIWEMPSGVLMPVITIGNTVTLPLPTLLAIRNGTGRAEGIIFDTVMQGYTVRITRTGSAGILIEIF